MGVLINPWIAGIFKVLGTVLLVALYFGALAQVPELTEAEYFIDTVGDPGTGTTLNVNPDSIIDENYSIPVMGVSEGAHKLYVRVKDDSGRWSHCYIHQFHVERVLVNAPKPNLVTGEFFFDTDPGFGNGYPLTFGPDSIIDVTQSIMVDTLSEGVHKLYVRVEDDSGRWSQCYIHQFHIEDLLINEPKPLLVDAEYFFDADPGFGNGHPISIANDSIIDKLDSLGVDTLSEGVHKLYVRVMDDSSRWSHCYIHQFDKEDRLATEVASDFIKFEYYFDSVYTTMGDPGYHNGTQVFTTQLPLVDTQLTIPVTGLTDTGHYYLFMRAYVDSANRWSLNNWHPFVKVPPLTCSGTMSSYGCGYEVSCNGASDGSINVTTVGGQPPYTFSWNDGPTTEDRSGLSAGTYTVIVTDQAGLDDTCNYVLTEPLPIACNDSISQYGCGYELSCNGASDGFIDLSPSGGCGPYTFAWSDGPTTEDRTSLTAGTYTVTITDQNSCTHSCSFTLNEPAALSCSGTLSQYGCGNEVSCNGASDGSITLSVSGGCLPYTYSWNDGSTTKDRTGLPAGSYSVTVTDSNGCTTSCNFNLTEPAVLSCSGVVSQYACDNVICAGGMDGSINVSINGGCAPYTYNWSDGATTQDRSNIGAGTYDLTVTDQNGCSTTCSFTLTEPDTLDCNGVLSEYTCGYNVSGTGATDGSIDLSVSGGCPGYSYLWNDGATTQDRTGLGVGTYSVTVTDQNGCTTTCSFTLVGPGAAVTVTGTLSSYSCGYNISCYGADDGSIDLTVTGGCQPYIFAWSDGDTTEDQTGLGPGSYNVTVTDQNGQTDFGLFTLLGPPQLSFSKSTSQYACGSQISCSNGTDGVINLSISGGCPPYAFNWSDGDTLEDRNGLVAGIYVVTVTDQNGCAIIDTTTLTEPTPVNASASLSQFSCGTNISCSGAMDGTIDLTVTGGCQPYNFAWSDGITTEDRQNLSTGTYNVTVTDLNGCTVTDSFVLLEPTSLAVNGSISQYSCGSNVSCYGASDGSIDLTVTGGCAPYSINWSDGATAEDRSGLTAGSYSVTVTDQNGCTNVESFILNEPSEIDINEQLSVYSCGYNISCTGGMDGSIDISVTGGCSPYTFNWSDGSASEDRTGLNAGVYRLTVTDQNGCTQIDSFEITEPAPLNIGSTLSQFQCGYNISCNGASDGQIDLSVSGGCAPYVFSWNDGSTVEDRTGLGSGNYRVTVTDQNGCTAVDSFILNEPAVLTVTEAISNYACGHQISCAGASDGSIDLTVAGGCTPYTFSWSDGSTSEDRTNLGAGVYGVTITDDNGCTATKSYTLTEPTARSISATVAQFDCGYQISCNGAANGAIDLTLSGGCTPYMISWNDGANTEDRIGLSAGTYQVTVTDQNGCEDSASFTLQEPSALSINTTLSEYECGFNVSCHGLSDGSIDLGITGGCAGYSVSWTDGDTNRMRTGLAAGMYQLTVSDQNGCSVSDSITLTEPDPLEIITEVITACEKRDLQATVTGGCASYQYLWISGDTTAILEDIQPGNYALTVTDQNGCSGIEGRNLTDTLIPLQVSVPVPNELPDCGEPGMLSASVEGGMGGYEHNWTLTSNQGSWSVVGGSDSGTVRFTAGALGDTATFVLEVTDSNECVAQSSMKLWCENKYTDRVLLVWPNPTWRDLNIQFIEPDYIGKVKFEMYDVLGRKIRDFSEAMENELKLAMNLYPLAQGQYLLQLQLEGSGEWITKKIMILR